MANKRVLKKNIASVCGDVAGVCLFSDEIQNVEGEKIAQMIIDLAELQDSTIAKVSVSYDKTSGDFENRKEYRKAKNAYYKLAYNTLIAQFNEQLQAIVKEMNACKE